MEEKKNEIDIQSFVNNLVNKVNKKEEARKEMFDFVHSFGAVKLEDGTVIKVRNNFIFLDHIWSLYCLCKSTGDEEKLKKLMADTNGGLFDCGDVVFRLEDIRAIFRSEAASNDDTDIKENQKLKSSLIDFHLDEVIFYKVDFSENDDDEIEDD